MAQQQPFRSTLTIAPLLCTGRILDRMPRQGTPVALAFSVRKVSTAYRGPCMRVRRSSDNREQDIGFVNTDIDVDELEAFAAGFDAFVSVWYDQSGRGRHATQPVATLQPQIVKAGQLLLDIDANQPAVRFDGTYLDTEWQPTEAEMREGAGISLAAAVGLRTAGTDVVNPQPGSVATRLYGPDLAVTTDYPNPQMPNGYDTYLLEALQTQPDGSTTELVYVENAELTHASINTTNNTVTKVNIEDPVPVPNGPPSLSVTTLDPEPAVTAATHLWNTGVKAGGRIFAVPNRATSVLEISWGTQQLPSNVRTLSVASLFAENDTTDKYRSAVVARGNVYCIPFTAQRVMKINTSVTPATMTLIGSGSLGENSGKWMSGALSTDGNVYAVPYNATTVLRINPQDDTVASINVTTQNGGSITFTGSTPTYFSKAVALPDGRVLGVPFAAGSLLVVDPANTPAKTAQLAGSTGLTFALTNGGRGYTAAPSLTLTAPPGLPTGPTASTAITLSGCLNPAAINVTAGGTYTSSPVVTITQNPTFSRPITQPVVEPLTRTGLNPTLVPIDPNDLQKGYRIASIRLSDVGDNLLLTGGTLSVNISGGKGSDRVQFQVQVVDKKVTVVTVVQGGSGFLKGSPPTLTISGGGGTGATVVVTGISDIVYGPPGPNNTLTSTGGAITAVRITNSGTGYTKTPTVSLNQNNKGGSATITFTTPTYIGDGKVTNLTLVNPGSGYLSNVTNGRLQIDMPLPGGGQDRQAEGTYTTNNLGELTSVTLTKCGRNYDPANPPTVTVLGGGQGASVTAEVAPDGFVSGVTLNSTSDPAFSYLSRPTITGLNVRGGDGTTFGGLAVADVYLDANGTYQGSSGLAKYMDAWLWQSSAQNRSFTLFCIPWNTTRVLKIIGTLENGQDTYTFELAFETQNAVTEQYLRGVATRDNSVFYGLPYGRNRVLKLQPESNTYGYLNSGRPYSGKWTAGAAAYNNNIYAVPGDSTALLIIDTKQEPKTKTEVFDNVTAGTSNVRWRDAVLAGDSEFNGLIYGIPSDINRVLELNPGVPLRSTSLPAPGCVLPDRKRIVFAPDRTGNVMVYDAGALAAIRYPIPAGTGRGTYAQGVPLPNGNVVFVPVYNQTDSFPYQGRMGIFNSVTNTWTYGPSLSDGEANKFVSIDKSMPYPSRAAVALTNTLVAWVPREGTSAAMMLYDFNTKLVSSAGVGRLQDEIEYASACAISDQRAVVVQPAQTTVKVSPPSYQVDVDPFSGAVMTRDGRVVLVPGSRNFIELFNPTNPAAALNVTPADLGTPKTRITFPAGLEASMVATASPKFGGGVLGADGLVYFVPFHRLSVMAVDPTDLEVFEFGTLAVQAQAIAAAFPDSTTITEDTPGMYWGGVLGADGRVYCVPHNADKVMVIDPTVQNPSARVSFVGQSLGLGGAKWRNGALGEDGRIYCAPWNASNVLVIDTIAGGTTSNPASLTGQDWLADVNTEKYVDVITGPDRRLYLVPYNARNIVRLNPTVIKAGGVNAVSKVDTRKTGAKFSSAASAPNGKLYFAPVSVGEVLEFDPATDTLEYYSATTSDVNVTSATVATSSGVIYAFPGRNFGTTYSIVPGDTYVNVYNHGVEPTTWTQCGRAGEFRLRPFAMNDGDSVLLHTSPSGGFAIFSANNTTTATPVVAGPSFARGVSAHFPALSDRVVSVIANAVTVVEPFEGGIAGVRSFSGTADLVVSSVRGDLRTRVGDNVVTVAGLVDALAPGGKQGVYSALASNAASELLMFARDAPLLGVKFKWTGSVGNTFSIGRVQGTRTPAFGAPAFTLGFSGAVSEAIAFSSDQNASGETLGENVTFHYLQNKLNLF
jgi:hypothetical protein